LRDVIFYGNSYVMLIRATWYAGRLAYMPNKGELMAMVVMILLQKRP
jgi:hypothetical protein